MILRHRNVAFKVIVVQFQHVFFIIDLHFIACAQYANARDNTNDLLDPAEEKGWKTEERKLDTEENGLESEQNGLETEERMLGSEGLVGKNNPCIYKSKLLSINVTKIAKKFK